jgi:hypothetical protein
MVPTDEAPGFDHAAGIDPTTTGPEEKVKWDCLSCGKYMGEQGGGGSFTLDFGYGSSYDDTRGICGWVCDECVTQKHGRLRVRLDRKAPYEVVWSNANNVPLAEHKETKEHVARFDFFGRRRMPWGVDHNGHPYESQGDRQYESLTSDERSRVESWLFQEDEALDRDVIVKLLQGLMESEMRVAQADAKRWEAERNALDRARNQAERLSAEELTRLRSREGKRLTVMELAQIWETHDWYERRWHKMEDEVSELREKVKGLETTNEALRNRLRIP